MNPNEIYKSFIEAGNAWAEAQYEFQQLDDQSKSMLAALTLEAKATEGVGSMAEAKEIALAAQGYRDHLRDVAKAKLVASKARVKYDAMHALFDAQRSVEATNRAALKAAP